MLTEQTKSYKYLIYFVAAFITCYLTQQVLLNRFISIGTGYITGGALLHFTSPLIIDVVAEVYGYKVARQILWCGLFSLFFMGICVGICLSMPHPVFWTNVTMAYNTALGTMTRTAIVSVVTVSTGQLINAYLISKWRILTKGKYFWLRSLGASVIGDSVTVILTIIGTFAGRIPNGMFTENLVPQLIIMVLFTALGAIPATFLAKIVAKAEGLNNYDVGINFNPFEISKKS